MHMLRLGLFLFCIGLALDARASEKAGEFSIRPTMPLTPVQLVALRQIVAADVEALQVAESIKQAAAPFASAIPNPLAVIHYEGLLNTDPKRIACVKKLREVDAVAALVRHWQASGNAETAAVLIRFVTAWAETYLPTGNDVNENKLVPLLVAWYSVGKEASKEQQTSVAAWVGQLGVMHLQAVKKSKNFTNRYTKHLRLLALCGLIDNRPEWLAEVRKGIERFVAGSLRKNGTSIDIERRDSLDYHCSSLKPPLELAMVLDAPELYAWTAEHGGSIKRSVDYVLPYARGEKVYKQWRKTKVGLDRERAKAGIAKYQPGTPWKPAEGLDLFRLASRFDPSLLPLVHRLSGNTAKRYGDWQLLVQAAMLDDGVTGSE